MVQARVSAMLLEVPSSHGYEAARHSSYAGQLLGNHGLLVFDGRRHGFTNGLIESGIMSAARAVLEFFGLREKDRKLAMSANPRQDTLHAGMFLPAKLVTPSEAVALYKGPSRRSRTRSRFPRGTSHVRTVVQPRDRARDRRPARRHHNRTCLLLRSGGLVPPEIAPVTRHRKP